MKRYTINQGYTFIAGEVDGRTVMKSGGEVIDLADDVAAQHAEKVTIVQTPAQDEAQAEGTAPPEGGA